MKLVSFYLPQYHAIPENDKWWGKGFTEWVTVKKAKSLFKGHNQPEEPYNENYYNLLDPEVMRNQSRLALKYGIDAFCYYHYWFDGKLLLEKPLENMLNDKMIKIPFCLCWANESWARTWDGQETNYLIKQNYEEDKDGFVNHYRYLSKFFKDERYLKENNKPIIVIYKPHLIKNIKNMILLWNDLAIADGFEGLYWGFQHPSAFECLGKLNEFNFGIEFEPLYTDYLIEGKRAHLHGTRRLLYGFNHPIWLLQKLKKKIKKLPSIRDYDQIWKMIIDRHPVSNNIYAGAFPSWDNTPRKAERGIVYFGATPKKFRMYLSKQIKHAKKEYKKEYLFINAWNEWGEGAHLEPDEINKMGYLEAVAKAKYQDDEGSRE